MPVFPTLSQGVTAHDARARVIVFENIALTMRIGAYEAERTAPQRVLVSAELLVRPAVGDPDDKLENVLDYDALHGAIMALAEGPHIALQETLAERVAAICLEPEEVAAVSVYVRKLDAYADCESVGIRIVRTIP